MTAKIRGENILTKGLQANIISLQVLALEKLTFSSTNQI